MAKCRNRARRRAENAELSALLHFLPYVPDPCWYQRYWYVGPEEGKLRRSLAAARRRLSGGALRLLRRLPGPAQSRRKALSLRTP